MRGANPPSALTKWLRKLAVKTPARCRLAFQLSDRANRSYDVPSLDGLSTKPVILISQNHNAGLPKCNGLLILYPDWPAALSKIT
jgi:hypothetical protein